MAAVPAGLANALEDRYRLDRELGQGGMATVYLAEDVKHRRKVAVKVLRPEIAATLGPERFNREIEFAARLQHPNILALHDSGEAGGFLYYVMPYVEGVSLRQRLAQQGELPVADAVRILTEVVEALAYAHAQGVVHRDLKPDNIMLSGRHPLVMDFGIAKAVSGEGGSHAKTSAGVALGTPAYMAPEQAVADPHLDHRVDIYAVGVMGYELLTGTAPFSGMSAQQVLAAQVTEAPVPISTRRPAVPPALEAILMRCLAKRPADRPQSAEAILHVLETLGTPSGGLTPTAARAVALARPHRPRWVWVAGAAAVAALALVLGKVIIRSEEPRSLPEPKRRQLTYDGNVGLAALSPDGQYLAYVVRASPAKLMVQDLVGGTALVVADSIGRAWSLSWLPDGARLSLTGEFRGRSMGSVYLFPRLGGAPAQFRSAPYLAWSPDGTRISSWGASLQYGLRVGDLKSGTVDSMAIPGADRWVLGGDWSPRGDLLALVTNSSEGSGNLWVVELATGAYVLTLADSVAIGAPHWAPRGNALYYLVEDGLYRLAVDPASGKARGAPRRLATLEMARGPSPMPQALSISSDGRKLAYVRQGGYTNFSVSRPPAGRTTPMPVMLTTGTAPKVCPTLSPDGASVAFLQETRDGWDLYRVPANGGTPERLTFGGAAERPTPDGTGTSPCPAWGPSGDQLAFVTRVGRGRKVAVVNASGGTPRIFQHTRVSQEIAWAPGARIAYQVPGNRNYGLLDPKTEGERRLVTKDSVGTIWDPTFSPDGGRVAVFWYGRRERPGLWIISLGDGSQVPLAEGAWSPIGWSADGRSVYASGEAGAIKRFSVAGGNGVVVRQPELKDAYCTPHERHKGLVWLCSESESSSDVWMIENFDPEYASMRGD